ncbi:MAG: LysM peptidoglycan-binding domain-containing protein [Chloroflexota bacterium]
MKLNLLPAFGILLLIVMLFGLALPAQASPAPQVVQYATPTPGPDGRIIYIIQPGDTCISISLKTGVPIDVLRGQNPTLDENCNLIAGQELLLGLGGPAVATPTAGPSPTPTPILPTPTPFAGTTELCVMLFNDINGDALRQEGELGIAGGAVSVTNVNGNYSKTQNTVSEIDPDTLEPVRTCFDDLTEGEYNISMAIPDNYNPTMTLAYTLKVRAGDRASVDFGAQASATGGGASSQTGGEGGRSPLMGILGAIFLLGGGALGWYALRMRKPEGRFSGRSLLKKK